MTATPTGRYERTPEGDVVRFTRTFTAPIEDVWAAVTESDRLARWILTWRGDPASGSVLVRLTAEEGEVDEVTYEILGCEPPRRLRVRTANDYGTWDLRLDLEHHDGTTTLTFSQLLADPGQMEDFGPGWEWYLDRLVAVETGGDPAAIDFARDYDPAMRAYYRALVPAGR